ncbi:MAG TPA: hypothetical protein VGC24_00785, partial [Burkholderiaceae bacterium]
MSLPKTPHILVRRPAGLCLTPSPCLTEDLRAQAKVKAAAKQLSKPGCFGFWLWLLALAFGFASASASAVASLLILSAFKASRAPQAETAEEARVSERSEFPR